MKRRHRSPSHRAHPQADLSATSKTPAQGPTLADVVHHYQQGQLELALQQCRLVAASNPLQAAPAHLLGLLLYQTRDVAGAEAALQTAVCLEPDYAAAWSDLGNIYSEQGRLTDAATAYQRALAEDPALAPAYNNLGIIYKNQGRLDEAIAAYGRAIQLRPEYADAYHNLGCALHRAGRETEAADAFRRVLQLEPDRTAAYKELCSALRSSGQLEAARGVLAEWLQREPEHPVAAHLLTAWGVGEVPSRAPKRYVQEVFDQFADTFDNQLAQLDYHGPELIGAALVQNLGAPCAAIDILDAGCGTGLCGSVLRPYARSLTGVDLSPGMLEKAHARQCFDTLAVDDLTGYLLGHPADWDLIVGCDTFNYFGDLAPLLAAAQQALRPGGMLVFTLELTQGPLPADGFRLDPSGRYSHAAGYVHAALATAGFELRASPEVTLRSEAHQPVLGLLFTATKPGPEPASQCAHTASAPDAGAGQLER